MTDSTARMLRRFDSAALQEAYVPRLTTLEYERLRQGTPWMTEKAGGATRSATTRRRSPGTKALATLGVATPVISANTGDPREARSAMEIVARAVAGQVVCTEAVVQAAPATGAVTYRPLGRVRLRNIARPWRRTRRPAPTSNRRRSSTPCARMQVTTESAARALTAGDVQRYFCLTACAAAFEAAPGDFAESG